jgi:hypothetical protein
MSEMRGQWGGGGNRDRRNEIEGRRGEETAGKGLREAAVMPEDGGGGKGRRDWERMRGLERGRREGD